MNFFTNNVFYWYVALSFFAIFGGSQLRLTDIAGGLTLMWILFVIFLIGFNLKNKYKPVVKYKYSRGNSADNFPLPLLSLIAAGASLFATFFYTGKSISDVLYSLGSNLSLYNDYQAFFAEQDLGKFSLSKLPAIFASLVLKLILTYSTIYIVVLTKQRNFKVVISYILVLISYLFFSLARGTTFEIFEILMLFWFCSGLRFYLYNSVPSKFSIKKLYLPIVMLLAILLYNYNIQSRYSFSGDFNCPTAQLCINKNSIIFFVSEPFARLFNTLSGYFTFGIFFSSIFISAIWFNSLDTFLLYLAPFSLIDNIGIINKSCGIILDCGVAWQPDVLKIIENLGVICLLGFIFILGKFCRKLFNIVLNKANFNNITLLFFLYLFLISMPIGNFVTASSSNTLLLTLSISIFIFRHVKFSKLRNE